MSGAIEGELLSEFCLNARQGCESRGMEVNLYTFQVLDRCHLDLSHPLAFPHEGNFMKSKIVPTNDPLANRDLNRLAAHSTLLHLSWTISGSFSAVFLLREGLSLPRYFSASPPIIVLRFAFRPAVLFSVRAIGLRSTLIVGTFLNSVQSPLLAPVHGVGVHFCSIAWWLRSPRRSIGPVTTRCSPPSARPPAAQPGWMAPAADRDRRYRGSGDGRPHVDGRGPLGGIRGGRRDLTRSHRAAARCDSSRRSSPLRR